MEISSQTTHKFIAKNNVSETATLKIVSITITLEQSELKLLVIKPLERTICLI